MKPYMQPGEYCYFDKKRIRCVEVSVDSPTYENCCKQCCLKDSSVCFFVLCRKKERPDGKTVIFVYQKTREKK